MFIFFIEYYQTNIKLIECPNRRSKSLLNDCWKLFILYIFCYYQHYNRSMITFFEICYLEFFKLIPIASHSVIWKDTNSKYERKKGYKKLNRNLTFMITMLQKCFHERIKNFKKSNFCFCFNVILSLLGFIRVAHFPQINKTWISKLNFSYIMI